MKQDRVQAANTIRHHLERPRFLRRTEFMEGQVVEYGENVTKQLNLTTRPGRSGAVVNRLPPPKRSTDRNGFRQC